MGDIRFHRHYDRIRASRNPLAEIRRLSDEDLVAALAASALGKDPYLANVLATETMNRVRLKDTVARTIADGVLALDGEGRIVFANPAAEAMLQAGDLLGRDALTFERADESGTQRAREQSPLLRPLATGQPEEGRAWFARDGSRMLPVAVVASPVRRDEQVVGVVAVVRDISSRLAADRRRAARLAATEVLSRATTITEATPALLKAIGGKLGWSVAQLWLTQPDGALALADGWYRDARASEAFQEASRVRRFAPGEGLPGEVVARREPMWLRDARASGNFPRAAMAARAGLSAAFAFPVLRGTHVAAVVEVFAESTLDSDEDLIELGRTLGAQIADFLDRADAEMRLRLSESRKSAFLASALDAVVGMDTQGRVIEWNPAATRMFGYAPEEALGRPMSDLIIPERLRAAHTAGIQRYLRTGVGRILGQRLEMPALRRDGSEFVVELILAAAEGEEGPIFVGYLRDLTEQKALLDRVRASENRYRALYEDIPLIYLAVEADGSIVTANRFGASQLGYEPDELIGENVRALVHPDDLARVMERFQAIMAGDRQGGAIEFRKLRKDGQVLWVSETMRLVRDVGERRMCLMVCEDISDWKRARERLDRSRERVLRILDSITDAFFAVDKSWLVIEANREAERALSKPREEMMGRSLWELFPQARGTEFERRYLAAMERGEAQHFEAYFEPFATWFEVHAYPSEEGLSVYFRDINARKDAEEEIRGFNRELEHLVRQRTAQLEQANEELEAFNYLVSHDLKEPVRAIEAFLAALEQDYGDSFDPEALDLLQRGRTSARALASLLGGLLEVGRVARLGGTLLSPVLVEDVLASPACRAQFESVLDYRQGTLEVQPGVPPVMATPSALCQILGNLVLNGLKHNAKPHPRVRVSGQRVAETQTVEIRIEDEGPGFPQAVLSAFRPGARPMSTTRGGFGLVIVRRVTARLGGTLELKNSPTGGVAIVRLPLA